MHVLVFPNKILQFSRNLTVGVDHEVGLASGLPGRVLGDAPVLAAVPRPAVVDDEGAHSQLVLHRVLVVRLDLVVVWMKYIFISFNLNKFF